MPQRPSKKVRVQPNAKPGAAPTGTGAMQASQQRRLEGATKAILGKFQGRKSV